MAHKMTLEVTLADSETPETFRDVLIGLMESDTLTFTDKMTIAGLKLALDARIATPSESPTA